MDRVTQQLLETRLGECRTALEERGEHPDPLEQLWKRALRSQMKEIEAALDRLSDLHYGVCEQCGESISPQRLGDIPWARHCFRCQTAQPHEHARLLRSGVVPSYWY